MLKYLLAVVSFVLIGNAHAQSQAELENKAVYNKFEFFYNTQLYDSIYNLASTDFQKQISKPQLTSIFTQLQTLGRISQGTLTEFKNGAAQYKVDIAEQSFNLILAVDSSLHYTTLFIKPYEAKAKPEEQKQTVISKATKDKPLDFYVDSIANSFAKQKNAQSLAIGIIHNNQSNHFFYGETEAGNATLPTETTLYEIGSITKTFTATLLADLVDRQIISLDDSIAKFLPDSVASNPDIQKITFKTLANHTSGLPRLPSNWNTDPKFNEADPYAHYDQKALYAFLKNYKATREPAVEYEYSNLGFGLLGELIATITKKPFQKSLADVITTPLAMLNTVDKINPKTQTLIKVYAADGQEVPQWSFTSMAAAGALKSTLADLLIYAQAQFVMPETDLEKAMALTRQFTFFIPPNTDIGLAWHMSLLDGILSFQHTGGTAGSSSFIALAPDSKTAVVILSNSAINVSKIGTEILHKALTTK
ncbi:serine hydrolase domain-containing protein [Sphingobacterium hungaricum]|uniref:Beta-lactamase-related domain-containing protein n=1 Tax=Sphingobacterium hungaricum TaxID=2082723 RepID=A0A928YRY3_9SPHI|nr:serine hydrolase domain-containing protein [Sphingobacterium hungaricum]MBE8714660.1 hypothetical protein [Sphingobacterium hungaricum]